MHYYLYKWKFGNNWNDTHWETHKVSFILLNNELFCIYLCSNSNFINIYICFHKESGTIVIIGLQVIFTFFILSLIAQIIFNEWVFHLYIRGESYIKRKKKKTSLLYSSLSSILTAQDGRVPRIYKPFLPLCLWLTHLLKYCWLFSQEMKEIKRALTLHLFRCFQLPCSCHFPTTSSPASSLPPLRQFPEAGCIWSVVEVFLS